jgi:hypothetical protein
MHYQANAHQPKFWNKAHHNINTDRHIRVQWMKPDAAATWIKNRVGQQVIKIYQHSGNENYVSSLPLLLEKHQGNDQRKNEM